METVDATKSRLESFIRDYCAQPAVNLKVDLSPGSVLSELLIKLSAQLHNQLRNDAEIPSSVNSVRAALDSTDDTFSASIDAVASNFGVTRDTGDITTGRVKVTVAAERTYYIGDTFQLLHPNLGATYTASGKFRVASSLTDSPSTEELKLYKEGSSGPYYFLLPVTGEVGAPAAPHNSSLVLNSTNTTLDGFVEARAFGNFSAGRAMETDRQLISRFQAGLSNRSLVSPQALKSLLPDIFPGVFTRGGSGGAVLSIVGATDPELNRGRHTTLGITPFGLADVYVRTSKSVQVGTFNTVATYDSAVAGSAPALWKIVLDSDTAGFPSWFYEVLSVSYTDDAGVVRTVYPQVYTGTPDNQTPEADMVFAAYGSTGNSLGGSNLVTTGDVARFTKYQRCTFYVVLDGVSTAGLVEGASTKELQVTVSYMPYVGEIQDMLLQGDNRVVAADYLVRAVIPCRVSFTMKLDQGSSRGVDAAAVKAALQEHINSLDFEEPLAVSRLVDICHDYDIRRVDLPISVTGSILVPSTKAGQTHKLAASDLLRIPSDSTLLPYGVSPKTTMFFAEVTDYAGADSIKLEVN